jgi:hypothetical protein
MTETLMALQKRVTRRKAAFIAKGAGWTPRAGRTRRPGKAQRSEVPRSVLAGWEPLVDSRL